MDNEKYYKKLTLFYYLMLYYFRHLKYKLEWFGKLLIKDGTMLIKSITIYNLVNFLIIKYRYFLNYG